MIKRFVFITRMVILLSAVVALPYHAAAQTYWQITTTTTPVGVATPPVTVTPGTSLAPTGKAYYVTDSTVTSVRFTIDPQLTPVGYTLSSVTVDGTRVVDGLGNLNLSGPYIVSRGVNLTHSIIANYTPSAADTFTVKSIATAGGWISPSQTVAKGGSATFTITANPGSTLTNVLVDGVATGDVDGSVTVSNVIANRTIQPVFNGVKSLRAVISIPPAMTVIPGTKIKVVGNTSPAYTSGVTFTWTATNGAIVGSQVVKDGVSTVEITAPATGIFSIGLNVAVVGQSVAAPVTSTVAVNDTSAANSCLGCHDGVGGPDSRAYQGTRHDTRKVTCQNCHNPNNDLSHAYKPVTDITCSTALCHTAFNHNEKVANNACLTCHNKHSLQASGNASCDFCHGNPPITTSTGVLIYTHTSSTCVDCHSVPPTTAATATHRDGKNEILTNANACSSCHSYPPAGSLHDTAVGGISPNCATCHIYTDYNGATHNNGTLNVSEFACTACHGMPPAVLTVARSGHTGQHLNVIDCAMCHGVGAGTNGVHKNGTVDVLISGAPHFNNVTSGMYPAAFVTSTSTCANCHNNNASNQTIRQQWAASGHANTTALPWIDYDFKTRTDGCVRCHTTTGFIAYSTAKVTAAWGTASDKTKEVLTCVGCHKDVASGVVRTVTPNKPFADDAAFTNADVSTSNICMDCHSGRNNGTSIQAKVISGADFTNLSYIAPHYLTAGGSLQGKSGYDFPGRTYAKLSDNAHGKVGTLNSNNTGTDGPCVACHMSATAKHSFSPVTVANGEITSITATACANCHTDSSQFTATAVEARKVAFVNALTVLKEVLVSKGIVVTDNYPYVANKNWGTGQAGANVMGAAFNYKLFATEPGAYAHNPEYAKQLVADSIEAVVTTGNTVTGSDISSYLTAGQKSALDLFSNSSSSCSSCHSYPPATSSHNTATTSPLNCSNCHTYTGVSGASHLNGTTDVNLSCTSCHGNPPTVLTIAISGHTGTHTTATDCATCHGTNPGATGHNNGTLATTCVACHGYIPADASHIKHITSTLFKKALCADCHSGYVQGTTVAANHLNNTIEVTTGGYPSPKAKGSAVSSCATSYCHSSGQSADGNSAIPVYAAVAPTWGGTAACGSCHATTNIATGSHGKHLTGIVGASCGVCHNGATNTAYNSDKHVNGLIDLSGALVSSTLGRIPGSGYTTCFTSCHGNPYGGQITISPKWGDNSTSGCLACHFGAGTITASGPATGSHSKHAGSACVSCHNAGTTATTAPNTGHSWAAYGTIDIVNVGYPANVTRHAPGSGYSSCSAALCHADPLKENTLLTTPVWGATATTGCAVCHTAGFTVTGPATGSHAMHNIGCTSCHAAGTSVTTAPATDHINGFIDVAGTAGNNGGGVGYPLNKTKGSGFASCSTTACHASGSPVWGASGGCDTCHGYPPMTLDKFTARVSGEFTNADVEDYAGGGGYHSSHLLSTVTAADGFTPCLPCHPSTNHKQGGATVTRANVDVFDAADTTFRLDASRPKTYDATATTCSNVSCHMKPSSAWKTTPAP